MAKLICRIFGHKYKTISWIGRPIYELKCKRCGHKEPPRFYTLIGTDGPTLDSTY